VRVLVSPSNISNNVQLELGRAEANAGFVVEHEFAVTVVDELDQIPKSGSVFGRVCCGCGRAGDAGNIRLCLRRLRMSRALESDTTLAGRDPPLIVNMMGDVLLCV
jgi:hypothetical protein